GGRPRLMTRAKLRTAMAMMADRGNVAGNIAEQLGISISTLHAYVAGEGLAARQCVSGFRRDGKRPSPAGKSKGLFMIYFYPYSQNPARSPARCGENPRDRAALASRPGRVYSAFALRRSRDHAKMKSSALSVDSTMAQLIGCASAGSLNLTER
ncbi:MAG: hypothetical protein WA417_19555, partial [Stellaceae bacterium]